MTDKDVLGKLMVALAKHRGDSHLTKLGKEMFDMYTAGGFPPDMFLDHVKNTWHLSEMELVFIVSEYQTHFLEHRRKSGINERRLDAIRRKNREDIKRLLETGELGIY